MCDRVNVRNAARIAAVRQLPGIYVSDFIITFIVYSVIIWMKIARLPSRKSSD